jgi:hypothetical protein
MVRFLIQKLVLISLLFGAAWAQETTTPMPKKNPPVTPTTRLAAAKTAFIRNAGGSSIPYNVISTSMEGWGRFQLVNSPEKADIILEVSSSDNGGGVTVSSSTSNSSTTGRPESTTSTSRDLSSGPVRLAVIDGKSKSVLWTGFEQPKFALRKKSLEDNLVDASEKLFTKFHDRVEPSLVK